MEPDGRLWRRLAAMRIEPAGAALTFETRLARENGWTRSHAADVMREYRRFLYLAATEAAAVTPSDDVDQAWHLHLTYSRHYWDELCGRILGRPLHHGPTEGGGAEDRRYRRQYDETIAAYRAAFGEAAPDHVWPDAATRFSARARRVDLNRSWVIPRPSPRMAAGMAALPLLAACAGFGEGGFPFVGLAVVLVVAILVIRSAAHGRQGTGDSSCGSSCGSDSSSSSDSSDGGSGGCGGSGCGGGGGD